MVEYGRQDEEYQEITKFRGLKETLEITQALIWAYIWNVIGVAEGGKQRLLLVDGAKVVVPKEPEKMF